MNESEFMRVRLRADDTHYGSDLIPAATLLGLMADCGALLGIKLDGVSGYLASWKSAEVHRPCYIGDFIEVRATRTRKGTRSRHYAVTVHRFVESDASGATTTGRMLDEPELICEGVYVGVVPAQQMAETQRSEK